MPDNWPYISRGQNNAANTQSNNSNAQDDAACSVPGTPRTLPSIAPSATPYVTPCMMPSMTPSLVPSVLATRASVSSAATERDDAATPVMDAIAFLEGQAEQEDEQEGVKVGSRVARLKTLERSFYATDEQWYHFSAGKHICGEVDNGYRSSCLQYLLARCSFSVFNPLLSVFGLPMLPPSSNWALVWQIAMLILDLTFTAFLVPIIIAFSNDLLNWEWLNIVDVVGGSLYIVDLVLNFNTGIVMKWREQEHVVMQGALVAEYYITKGTFCIDVVAALPTIPLVVLLCLNDFSSDAASLILTLFRLMRLMRLHKALKALYHWTQLSLIYAGTSWAFLFNAVAIHFYNFVFLILIFVNGLACLWFFVAEREGIQHSWMEPAGVADEPPFTQYWASVQFIMATVTTIGYGQIAPQNLAEYIVSCLIMIIGVMLFGVILAAMTEFATKSSGSIRRASALRDRLSNVELWARRRQFTNALLQDIRAFYIDTWTAREDAAEEGVELALLPFNLRRRVAWHITAHVLEHDAVFSQLPEPLQRIIAARMTPLFVAKGADLTVQGQTADCMWMLQSGALKVLRHAAQLDVIQAPCFVGQAALLSYVMQEPQPRSATLRASSNCMLWRLEMSDLVSVLQGYPPIIRHWALYFRDRIERQLNFEGEQHPDRASWVQMIEQLERAAEAGRKPSERKLVPNTSYLETDK